MTLYALLPTRRPEHGAYPGSNDQQVMNYFIVLEFSSGSTDAEEDVCPTLIAVSATSVQEEGAHACPHAEPEGPRSPADEMPRADLIHLSG
jgi:hypothetical protein